MPTIIHKNKEHLDSLVIGAGHSIMAGYIPPSIPVNEFSEKFYQWTKKNPESISQFGFWGGDIDYNTYYPGLSEDELNPKDSEFIEPMFRLLSATIVSKNYNPTDFGSNGVLRASMNMLLGQTVNCDHETNIGNAIGAVSKVVWQEAYKDGDFVIPAGINGVLKIDGKANPRIARGILMEPPSIHSNSVTVQFKWDKSHPKMDDNEFYMKLGSYDDKGVMVRRIVTEVVRYLETSLVSHGADSFAQKIGEDGKLVNPSFAKRTWSSYSEYQEDKAKSYFFEDYKTNTALFKESNETQAPVNNQNTNNQQQMNELELFIESLTGSGMLQLAEGTEKNQEAVISALKAVITERDQFRTQKEALESEKTSLTEKVNKLDAEVTSLKAMATIGTTYMASLRETTLANYKKVKGDQADETIINLISSEVTPESTLKSLNKDYLTQLEEKFPLTCSKCGSHEVSRASSAPDTTAVEHNQEEQDVFGDIYRQKLNPNK